MYCRKIWLNKIFINENSMALEYIYYKDIGKGALTLQTSVERYLSLSIFVCMKTNNINQRYVPLRHTLSSLL